MIFQRMAHALSFFLQMMPGGMMPATGGSSGTWTLMTLAVIAGTIAAAAIVVFVLRYERRPAATVYGLQQAESAFGPPTVQASSPATRPTSDIMGRVVLSLASTLMDDERRVMDEMARAGGEVLQSDLPKMTGFSKATISKAIHGLEVRGIVVREKHKWTYWCKVNPRLVERTAQSDTVALTPPNPMST
jgi:MarR family protein